METQADYFRVWNPRLVFYIMRSQTQRGSKELIKNNMIFLSLCFHYSSRDTPKHFLHPKSHRLTSFVCDQLLFLFDVSTSKECRMKMVDLPSSHFALKNVKRPPVQLWKVYLCQMYHMILCSILNNLFHLESAESA